mmetsp:Transcript_61272/g.145878  ORF Transcript_61272/g.145878 Transcript_61272/m.145878 type:complete len:1057 (+) Transcript_61272:80-3250(+)
MSLEELVGSISSEMAPADAQQVFSTVQLILQNIIDKPQEVKFRTPTKQKVEAKLGPKGMELLRCLGFTDSGEKFVLPDSADLGQLEEAMATIECLAASLGDNAPPAAATSAVDTDGMDPETAEAIRLSMEGQPGPKRQRADESGDAAMAEAMDREESRQEVAFERFRQEDVVVDQATVEEINTFCRASGEKYVDPQFPPTNKSIYMDENDATEWACLVSGCRGRTKLPPVPPLPKSREEAEKQEEDFNKNVRCSKCGAPPGHVAKVQYFNRPLQWLRPGERCVGCEMVYGHLQGGKELISRLCPHYIRDTMSETTVGVPWKVIRSEARAEDVCQGALGNCWFAGALSVVARVPQLIENLFITKEFNPNGAYALRLFHAGAWQSILIDDLMPTSQIFEGYIDGTTIYYSRGGNLTYLHGARRQLWVPLVEKAAAKLFRCYQGMKGGTFGEALSLFTGCPVEKLILYIPKEMELRRRERRAALAERRTQLLLQGRDPSELPESDDDDDEVGNDDLNWTKLMSANEQGYLMGMGCTEEGVEKTKDEIAAVGLQAPHAYGILDVREVMVNGKLTRMVKVRNPWGERSPKTWLGDWGKDSSKWTYALKLELGRINRGGVEMEDPMSIFWMEFQDVKKYFSAVEICRLHVGWKEIQGKAWLPSGVGAGECFELTVYRKTQVDLTLWQETHIARMGMTAKSTNIDVGFAVLRRRNDGIQDFQYEFVEYFRRTLADSVGGELILDGGFTYRVVPVSYGFMQEVQPRKGVLVVHSVQKIDMKTTRMAWGDLAHAIGESCRRRAKKIPLQQMPQGVSTWLLQDERGYSFYVENPLQMPVALQVDCSDCMGCVSTPSSMSVVSCIPPQCRQVVFGLATAPGAERFRIGFVAEGLPAEAASWALPGEDLHAPLPLVPEELRRVAALPDATILENAPPEEPLPPPPLGTTRPPVVSAGTAATNGDVEMSEEDMLAEALKMSMEGKSSATPAAASNADEDDELAEAIRMSMMPNSQAPAAAAAAPEAPKKLNLQDEVKRLFEQYKQQGMAPNEAAAKALKDAQAAIAAAR